jgi:hypothetical protein
MILFLNLVSEPSRYRWQSGGGIGVGRIENPEWFMVFATIRELDWLLSRRPSPVARRPSTPIMQIVFGANELDRH